MEKPYSYYFDASALRREYLIGDAFLAKYTTISRDFIWQEQNERFKRLLGRAWRMQFYRRLWGEHGVKPGDIRSLLDIEKLPVFAATYLLAAQEDPASFGDFTGTDSYALGLAPPVIAQYFGPRSAEINQQLSARAAILQAIPAKTSLPQPSIGQSYRSNHAGLIAIEGNDRDGLYIMEDAHYVEILSPKTDPVCDGIPGELVLTSLYKDDIAPVIRFNTRDIASIYPGESSLGLNLRRIKYFAE